MKYYILNTFITAFLLISLPSQAHGNKIAPAQLGTVLTSAAVPMAAGTFVGMNVAEPIIPTAGFAALGLTFLFLTRPESPYLFKEACFGIGAGSLLTAILLIVQCSKTDA
jgi:hypothetical protein